MEIFLFFLHYALAFVFLYHILFCSYAYDKHYGRELIKTNEKYKKPLWLILSFIVIFFIPLVNLIVFGFYIRICDIDKVCYFKSFLTKEY